MADLDLDAIRARAAAKCDICGGRCTDHSFVIHNDVPKLVAEVKRLRRLSENLARRLADHADCDEHLLSSPAADCPFCGDRAAYLAYVSAGGRDFRPVNSGPTVDFFEFVRRHRSASNGGEPGA